MTHFNEIQKMRLHQGNSRWRLNMKTLDDSDGDTFLSVGVRLTVREPTAEKYTAAVAAFILYLVDRDRGYKLESFVRYLSACRKQGAAAGTLAGFRAAIVWAQRCSGTPLWGEDAILIRALKGYAYQDKLRRAPRGAIDMGMLEDLIKLFPRNGNAYAAIFLCVLRKSQAEKLRGGDAHMTAAGQVSLTVRADKRNKAGTTYEHTAVKEILSHDAKALIMSLSGMVRHGALIFDGVDFEALSEDIKRAAVILRWPAHLVFDGIHCLRHGGAQVVKAFVCAVLERAGNNCGMSAKTATWYSRMNEARVHAQAVIDNEGVEEDETDDAVA